jgi:hypothetical protein
MPANIKLKPEFEDSWIFETPCDLAPGETRRFFKGQVLDFVIFAPFLWDTVPLREGAPQSLREDAAYNITAHIKAITRLEGVYCEPDSVITVFDCGVMAFTNDERISFPAVSERKYWFKGGASFTVSCLDGARNESLPFLSKLINTWKIENIYRAPLADASENDPAMATSQNYEPVAECEIGCMFDDNLNLQSDQAFGYLLECRLVNTLCR